MGVSPIHYSDGNVILSPVVIILDDLSVERAGFFRAFWASSPDAITCSPVIGYCSPGGTHRTIRACAAEVRRLYPEAKVYRNEREVKPDDH